TIDKKDGKIYWLNQDENNVVVVMRANLADGTGREVFAESPGFPYALIIPYDYTIIPPVNTPPTAVSVSITGTPTVGETVTGTYHYNEADEDEDDDSTYQWYRYDAAIGDEGKTAIEGATEKAYKLQAADEGKYISFEVTPHDGTDAGAAVESEKQGPVLEVCNPTPVAGVTSFDFISSYVEFARSTDASVGIRAANIGCTGWNVEGYTTPGTDTFVIAGENWGSGSDEGLIYLALEDGEQTILSLNFKSNDGKLFDLNTIDLGYDVIFNERYNDISFTITGYKKGSAVAEYTVASFAG